MADNVKGSYHHKAQMSNDLNSSAVSNKRKIACHGYSFEGYPDSFDMHPFTDRANSFRNRDNFYTLWEARQSFAYLRKIVTTKYKVRIKLF